MAHPETRIETARLVLRTMRLDDLEALLAIFGDPTVMAAFGLPSFDRQQTQKWLQRNLEHQAHYGFGLFSVVLKESGLLIGDCGLEIMQLESDEAAELGYDFRSDYWNCGYATEAASAVHIYARQLNLSRIVSMIRVGNQPSRRVAEKIGMRLVETYQRGEHYYWLYESHQSRL